MYPREVSTKNNENISDSDEPERISISTKRISALAPTISPIQGYMFFKPGFWSKTSWIQLGYGLWVNLALLSTGLALGFPAVTVPQLKKSITITTTTKEAALVASILTLSCPMGCLISGLMLDRCGRKISMVLSQIPFAVGWFYVALSKTAKNIIIGRAITGVGMGMVLVAPRAYVAEITLPNMRGVIGAIPNLFISLGLTIQATLGAFFDWRILCYVCGTFCILLTFLYLLLPETPYFLLMKTNTDEARNALKRFRCSKFDIEREMQTLHEFKIVNDIRRLSLQGTVKAMFRPSSCKPFSISVFYMALTQVSGVMVVTAWAVEMLQHARSPVNPNLGFVLLCVTRVLVSFVTSYLLFKVNRRPLAVITAVGVGVAALFFGGYLKIYGGGIFSLILLEIYVIFAVPGYLTLPVMMMFELLPLQVRGILGGTALSISCLIMFGAILVYPSMRDAMGMHYTFITYGCISLIGAIILCLILPETKGLTLQEIEEYFNKRRATLISERELMPMQLRQSSIFVSNDSGNK